MKVVDLVKHRGDWAVKTSGSKIGAIILILNL